jgi:hypothetical protein
VQDDGGRMSPRNFGTVVPDDVIMKMTV